MCGLFYVIGHIILQSGVNSLLQSMSSLFMANWTASANTTQEVDQTVIDQQWLNFSTYTGLEIASG